MQRPYRTPPFGCFNSRKGCRVGAHRREETTGMLHQAERYQFAYHRAEKELKLYAQRLVCPVRGKPECDGIVFLKQIPFLDTGHKLVTTALTKVGLDHLLTDTAHRKRDVLCIKVNREEKDRPPRNRFPRELYPQCVTERDQVTDLLGKDNLFAILARNDRRV